MTINRPIPGEPAGLDSLAPGDTFLHDAHPVRVFLVLQGAPVTPGQVACVSLADGLYFEFLPASTVRPVPLAVGAA